LRRLEIVMTQTLSDFLGGYQRGVEVAVAAASPDELLGVREAFRRYFHDGLDRPVAVAVVGQEGREAFRGIAASDRDAIEVARRAARRLAERLGDTYQFYVASEACIEPLPVDDGERFVVRNWTAVVGPPGEALGGSGSFELPRLLSHGLTGAEIAAAVPGTRRDGGMIARLTGGLETRRNAVALATLAALSTLFYGILESHPGLRR
jgi:non-canonical (house-cleaning) NTP pyrophosphatase